MSQMIDMGILYLLFIDCGIWVLDNTTSNTKQLIDILFKISLDFNWRHLTTAIMKDKY